MVPVVTLHIDMSPDCDQESLFDLSDNMFPLEMILMNVCFSVM